MKKWLTDSSFFPVNENILDKKAVANENETKISQINCPSVILNPDTAKLKMGLGVSSEPGPSNAQVDHVGAENAPSKSEICSEVQASSSNRSSALAESVSSRSEASQSNLSQQTVSVEFHQSTAKIFGSLSEPRASAALMSLSPMNAAAFVDINTDQFHQPTRSATTHNPHYTSKTSREATSTEYDAQEGTSSLSFYSTGRNLNSHERELHCIPDSKVAVGPVSRLEIAAGYSSDAAFADSSSENDSRPESCIENWCSNEGPRLYNSSTQCGHESSSEAYDAQNRISSHLFGATGITASSSGASMTSSSGCGHFCSACRVRVQVEVECVPGSQRSPSGNRHGGVRTLSFPKRVRHKAKAPTKDYNGSHKKKKSPWSFRLNCRLRANKNDEPEQDLSTLNVGCVSCVCPGYRQPDPEPVYRSVTESNLSGNAGVSLRAPVVDQSYPNSEASPVSDLEENARQDRSKDRAEGVEHPPGFISYLIKDNPNSLAFPLTYSSMLDLQLLLESSLRLGFLSRTVHTQVDYIHCLVPDLLAITNCRFYWGKMDRYEAERLLENRPEGTFLLRDSAQEEYLFSVSFRRYERSLHARIEQWDHKFSFDSHNPVFASPTVCGLIEHYKDPSCCMFFEPLLTNPLARTFPFSLQHLCRATICSRTSYDSINYLELPKSLKNYLKEYHYKQRVRIRHLE